MSIFDEVILRNADGSEVRLLKFPQPKAAKPDADVLADAREFIEQEGWTQGTLRNEEGVCAVGAIVYSQMWLMSHDSDVTRLCNKVLAALGNPSMPTFDGGANPMPLTWWNDHAGRTKQEVLDAFAKAEKIERAGFDPDA